MSSFSGQLTTAEGAEAAEEVQSEAESLTQARVIKLWWRVLHLSPPTPLLLFRLFLLPSLTAGVIKVSSRFSSVMPSYYFHLFYSFSSCTAVRATSRPIVSLFNDSFISSPYTLQCSLHLSQPFLLEVKESVQLLLSNLHSCRLLFSAHPAGFRWWVHLPAQIFPSTFVEFKVAYNKRGGMFFSDTLLIWMSLDNLLCVCVLHAMRS